MTIKKGNSSHLHRMKKFGCVIIRRDILPNVPHHIMPKRHIEVVYWAHVMNVDSAATLYHMKISL